MSIKHIIKRLRETKVLENYTYMTALNIFTALISLIIYPYIIRVTGKYTYGIYVYAMTIALYFQIFLDFGFESPCAKAIVKNINNSAMCSEILSAVFSAKTYFYLLSIAIFCSLYAISSFVRENLLICLICFLQSYALSLFPQWYFQAIKDMKRVTYINLSCRLLTIPFIFLFVKNSQDIWIYALITTISYFVGTIIAYIFILNNKLKIKLLSLRIVFPYLKEAFPFFISDLAGNLKEGLLKTIIKNVFGIAEVAVYDLAIKLISIVRIFTQNINKSLFPEFIDRSTKDKVRQILKYERIIGLTITVLTCLVAYPAILLLGGSEMLDAFPLVLILSWTIYSYLIIRVYLDFVFVASGRYLFVTKNQLVALSSSVLLSLVGLFMWHNVATIALALSISGFIEIIYCRYVCIREKLL